MKYKLDDILIEKQTIIHCNSTEQQRLLITKCKELGITTFDYPDPYQTCYLVDYKNSMKRASIANTASTFPDYTIIEFNDIIDFQPTNTPEEPETKIVENANDCMTDKIADELHNLRQMKMAEDYDNKNFIIEEQRREIDFIKGQNKRLMNKLINRG